PANGRAGDWLGRLHLPGDRRYLRCLSRGRLFACREQIPDDLAHLDLVPGFGSAGGNGENTSVQGFNLFGGFIAFERKQEIAGLDRVAIALQPFDEGSVFHRPAQPGNSDLDGHDIPSCHSSNRFRMARSMSSTWGTTAFSSVGL